MCALFLRITKMAIENLNFLGTQLKEGILNYFCFNLSSEQFNSCVMQALEHISGTDLYPNLANPNW